MAKLAIKYFQSHGPAQLKDFSWWSGLSAKESAHALSMIKSKLNMEAQNQKEYWYFPTTYNSRPTNTPPALLISIFDEYTIAYKDRSDLSEKNDIEKMISMGNALTAVIILNGKVAGTWKRKLNKNEVIIKLSPFRNFTKTETNAINNEVQKYAKFLELKAAIA